MYATKSYSINKALALAIEPSSMYATKFYSIYKPWL